MSNSHRWAPSDAVQNTIFSSKQVAFDYVKSHLTQGNASDYGSISTYHRICRNDVGHGYNCQAVAENGLNTDFLAELVSGRTEGDFNFEAFPSSGHVEVYASCGALVSWVEGRDIDFYDYTGLGFTAPLAVHKIIDRTGEVCWPIRLTLPGGMPAFPANVNDIYASTSDSRWTESPIRGIRVLQWRYVLFTPNFVYG